MIPDFKSNWFMSLWFYKMHKLKPICQFVDHFHYSEFLSPTNHCSQHINTFFHLKSAASQLSNQSSDISVMSKFGHLVILILHNPPTSTLKNLLF